MTGYLVRRLIQAVIAVLGVTIVTFILLHMLPGSIAREVLGRRATAVQVAVFNRVNGLNKPLVMQYLGYLARLLHGNLGRSFQLNESVTAVLAQDLPKDVLLVGPALVVAVLIAMIMGTLQAVKRNSVTDHALTIVSFTLYSMPSFALGLLLIQLFAIQLRWLPAEAPQGSTIGQVLGNPTGLILPMATITLVSVALFSRYMRSAGVECLTQDYIRTARAKGLAEKKVIWSHMLRNSLVPVITMIGLMLPAVISIGLVVEYLFNYPGVGLAYFNAAINQDYPVELGITLVVAITTVLGSLLADISYAVLDPRVRYV